MMAEAVRVQTARLGKPFEDRLDPFAAYKHARGPQNNSSPPQLHLSWGRRAERVVLQDLVHTRQTCQSTQAGTSWHLALSPSGGQNPTPRGGHVSASEPNRLRYLGLLQRRDVVLRDARGL
jgi:hypothetical protein